jgi:hypothetical protein
MIKKGKITTLKQPSHYNLKNPSILQYQHMLEGVFWEICVLGDLLAFWPYFFGLCKAAKEDKL